MTDDTQTPTDAEIYAALDTQAAMKEAADAVASAARPGLLNLLRLRAVKLPSSDPVDDARQLVTWRMVTAYKGDTLKTWMDTTGTALTAALCTVVRDMTEMDASYLIGAAMHAHVAAGADLAPDAVLRLAERAACWRAGLAAIPH